MGFCTATSEIWQLVGNVVTIFKIVIPVILILFGCMDLGKAIVSSDDKEISKSATKLAKRAAAGILIFFIPTIVNYVFEVVGQFDADEEADYQVCSACVANPSGDKCKDAIKSLEE